jgi:hypothetical protein
LSFGSKIFEKMHIFQIKLPKTTTNTDMKEIKSRHIIYDMTMDHQQMNLANETNYEE